MSAVLQSMQHPGRRAIRVRGAVQGVGFRPFVHRLASELALAGWVRNDGAGVMIEIQGTPRDMDTFLLRLRTEMPRLARIDALEAIDQPAVAAAHGFGIAPSGGGPITTMIGVDTAVCDDCLAELFDPRDRRHRYAFINCTHCGPRYTITGALPYDRATTSMAPFAQCPSCRSEYRAPDHRRFHAEPNACPDCGPQLALLDAVGGRVVGDPIAAALARLRAGEIVAVKGLGGFHLACDARNAAAVARLRARKNREEKPFAVLVANAASMPFAAIADAQELLESPERPIVLARKHAAADAALPEVAPGLAWLGVMLPYTPLQYLLFHEFAGRPDGIAWLDRTVDLVLVMTSANPGGEPIVTGNDEALARLAGIADAFLVHDRNIVARCDDSVVRAVRGTQFVRRARGYTPRPIRLARGGPSVLAVGGHLKNTICVTRDDEAFLSPHIGDLDNVATCTAMAASVAHLLDILQVTPAAVAHDLHPDFHSTRFAAAFAAERGLPTVPVQHHHAHVAAIAAEQGRTGPVLGLALDGVGLGDDGAAWGGELLQVEGRVSTRLGHLRPIRLPGGDRAAREPWRMAAAALALLGRADAITSRFASLPAARAVAAMLDRGLHAPETTSMGRWFDAAAGLLGVRKTTAFEGQAAMLLEGLAERHGAAEPDRGLFAFDPNGALDLAPLLARLADERDAAFGAALFHATLATALADWVTLASDRTRIRTVALAGGCFLNAILSAGVVDALTARGIEVLEARQAPPNDGGLALGQAWVALLSSTTGA